MSERAARRRQERNRRKRNEARSATNTLRNSALPRHLVSSCSFGFGRGGAGRTEQEQKQLDSVKKVAGKVRLKSTGEVAELDISENEEHIYDDGRVEITYAGHADLGDERHLTIHLDENGKAEWGTSSTATMACRYNN